MGDRILKELIPDGWEMVAFSSHDFMVIRYDEDGNELEEPIVEQVYRPYLTIRNKNVVTAVHYKDFEVSGYDYEEHTTYLTDREVRTLMQTLTTTGGKP